MRELELRLALVCFGGASLAVYMNGISAEILKLVRASRAFHASTPPPTSAEASGLVRPETMDTEAVWFDLLRVVSGKVKLRVVVDVISGASAGGINGIFLARAIAHDLSFAPLRDMWLNLGDIEELMEEDTLADVLSKFYMRPFMWMYSRRMFGRAGDPEIRRKLSRFVRSRWFEPPFSGEHMLTWMIDACLNMGESGKAGTLMPPGHSLDLFVSLTNFGGQRRIVELHDPKEIYEPQHQLTLHFSHRSTTAGVTRSDFQDANAVGLGFAARGTSSFPGAFPPVSLADLKAHITRRKIPWPMEEVFLTRNFATYLEDREALQEMYFIDGGVTNNKPFAAAIKAIGSRSAHRPVDRRLIFVDPNPDRTAWSEEKAGRAPGFVRTILASIAEIPRNEPIFDDLSDIADHNARVRQFETLTGAIETEVGCLIEKAIYFQPGKKLDSAMLASWREQAHELTHREAGIAYRAYMQVKASQILERLPLLLHRLTASAAAPASARRLMREAVRRWAEEQGIVAISGDDTCPIETRQMAQIGFFRTTDVDYRIRRLRYLVRKVNRHMWRMDGVGNGGTDEAAYQVLRQLKRLIYDHIEALEARWTADHYAEACTKISAAATGMTPDAIGKAVAAVQECMALEDIDLDFDAELIDVVNGFEQDALRHDIIRAYVGFSFHDALLLPVTGNTDVAEMERIKVDRISPRDCMTLLGHHFPTPLKGTQLHSFGAFFSRTARENDYLWGRLHAASRLVDLIFDAAGDMPHTDPDMWRQRLFTAILRAEVEHLPNSRDMILDLMDKFGANG
ncbi:patatin-like protein [Gimibacter soli]|uniref:Patatin-like protein n=1 Tax=Gimibacter soli TaxID=3024400 RepID=A0AAE9XUU2_9PROT|nr:patatin-like protein [Gimibacter soli]WCL55536.1 patatin-like protein [Gimibacter soli]